MRIGSPDEPSMRLVPVPPRDPVPFAASYRSRITVDTLHDGDMIPERVAKNAGVAQALSRGALTSAYQEARDWGANLVAHHLAEALGLGGYHQVAVARLVMDFNRFPGESLPEASPMEHRALGGPIARLMTHAEKRYVLSQHYDVVSAGMDHVISGRLLKVGIHTYDPHNVSRTRRPEVSLLTRSASYQQRSRLPSGLFDPLFPDILAESCAKPIVRDRIALTLEKAGLSVEHNYPYSLPDGSVEIRCQPWLFFQHLRKRFQAAAPQTRGDEAFERIWTMLLNTNHRDAKGGALRGYLHRFRRAPAGQEAAYEAARLAYESICAFVAADPTLVDRYRRSPDRTSAITIEVRKDLVWDMDGARPIGPRQDSARSIARLIAEAIATYLREDRDAPPATRGP